MTSLFDGIDTTFPWNSTMEDIRVREYLRYRRPLCIVQTSLHKSVFTETTIDIRKWISFLPFQAHSIEVKTVTAASFRLPPDLHRSIFRWLPLRMIFQTARVCKEWNAMITPELWAGEYINLDQDLFLHQKRIPFRIWNGLARVKGMYGVRQAAHAVPPLCVFQTLTHVEAIHANLDSFELSIGLSTLFYSLPETMSVCWLFLHHHDEMLFRFLEKRRLYLRHLGLNYKDAESLRLTPEQLAILSTMDFPQLQSLVIAGGNRPSWELFRDSMYFTHLRVLWIELSDDLDLYALVSKMPDLELFHCGPGGSFANAWKDHWQRCPRLKLLMVPTTPMMPTPSQLRTTLSTHSLYGIGLQFGEIVPSFDTGTTLFGFLNNERPYIQTGTRVVQQDWRYEWSLSLDRNRVRMTIG